MTSEEAAALYLSARGAAVDEWALALLKQIGLDIDQRDEIRARCVLVQVESPRLLGEPWVDEYRLQVDGRYFGHPLRITTTIVTEAA